MKISKNLKDISIMVIIFLFVISSSLYSMKKKNYIFGFIDPSQKYDKLGAQLKLGEIEKRKIKESEIRFPTLKTIIVDYSFLKNGREIILSILERKKEKYSIYLYDLNSKELKLIREMERFVMEFSPDGKHYAVPLNDKIILRDLYTDKEVQTFKLKGIGAQEGERNMVFSPDGKYIGAYSKKIIKVWDVETGKCIYKIEADKGDEFTIAISLSNNATYIAVGIIGYDNFSLCRILKEGKKEKGFLHDDIWGIALSYDGKYLVLTGIDTLKIFDVGTMEGIGEIEGKNLEGVTWKLPTKKEEDIDIKERIQFMLEKTPGIEKRELIMRGREKIEIPKVLSESVN